VDPEFYRDLSQGLVRLLDAQMAYQDKATADRSVRGFSFVYEARVLEKTALMLYDEKMALEAKLGKNHKDVRNVPDTLKQAEEQHGKAQDAIAIMKSIRRIRGDNPDNLRSDGAFGRLKHVDMEDERGTQELKEALRVLDDQDDYEMDTATGLMRGRSDKICSRVLARVGDDFSDVPWTM